MGKNPFLWVEKTQLIESTRLYINTYCKYNLDGAKLRIILEKLILKNYYKITEILRTQ